MSPRRAVLLAAVLALLPARAGAQATLEGRVTLPKTTPAPVVNQRYEIVSKGVVVATNPPLAAVFLAGTFPKPATPPVARLIQKDLAFVPALLPVQTGTKVEFPNLDDQYHNIFSYSPPKRFALGRFRYSTELKNAPLSSRPASWTRGQQWWTYPAVAARLGYAPNPLWAFGVSASTGTYLRPSAGLTLAPGLGRGDYRQRVVAADVALAWRHWQVWAELYRTRFALPRIGDADTLAGYVEAKYKFTPQLFGAVRWNRQILGTIPDGPRGPVQWGRDVSRLDLAPGYRFTPHVKLKLQDTWQAEPAAAPARTETLATQLTVRF